MATPCGRVWGAGLLSQRAGAAPIRPAARSWRTTERGPCGPPPCVVCLYDAQCRAMTKTAYPRATRAGGRQTRRALLDAAGTLFADRGLAGVSASEIAREAGAFPS